MAKRPIKVIQFGEGNFLRAFVDWMIQKMNDEGGYNGGIAVVQPLETGLIDILAQQEYTYTHYMRGMKDGEAVSEHYKNNSIEIGINPYCDFDGYLNLAHIDTARVIVSNTTEAGITFDPEDTMEKNGNVTFPGKLTRLLFERYMAYNGARDKGFIVLPCELIDKNAEYLKKYVLQYVDLWKLGEEFKTWVEEANVFCNTLVDRIVPGYPRERIEEIWEELGYTDHLVVESEQFNLWVIEGDQHIRNEFPANQKGCHVIFVEDVRPYKMRKVRILNGAHTTLVPVAYLYGARTVRESVEDATLNRFLTQSIYEEIIPTLSLSSEELETFAKEVLERFKNPFVKHYLMSISLNSMSKYKTRVLPSVLAYLDTYKRLPKRTVFALAAYIVFYRGTYNGEVIEVQDSQDIIDLYTSLWADFDGTQESIIKIVEGVLGFEGNWDGDLNTIPNLTVQVSQGVEMILNQGMDVAIKKINEVS